VGDKGATGSGPGKGGNKQAKPAEPSRHVEQPNGRKGGNKSAGKTTPNPQLAEAKKRYEMVKTWHEAAVEAGEEGNWPLQQVESCKQAYDTLLAQASAGTDRAGYLRRLYEAAKEAAVEFAVAGGDDPDELPEVKQAYQLWKAAASGQPSGETVSPTLKKVRQRQTELANARYLWKTDPTNPEGKAQIASIEELLDDAKRADGRTPVDDLRATQQAIAAGYKARGAKQGQLDKTREEMEVLHERQDLLVDEVDAIQEGIDANEAKFERQKAEMAKESTTTAQAWTTAPPAMQTAQSLIYAITAMYEGHTRNTWADGGKMAVLGVLELANSLQATIPQGLSGQITDMPADKPEASPGRRWSTGSGSEGKAAMEVDGTDPQGVAAAADAAAANAKDLADAAEVAAKALRLQTAEASQAAATAKQEAAKLAAQADGFKTVGKSGKPTTA
jgi:hypothetical protein